MNLSIKIDRILDYYDVPQLFIASDQVEGKYIALLVQDTPKLTYIATKISTSRLGKFIAQSIDLRELFLYPEIPSSYYYFICEENKITVSEYESLELSEELLPDSGYFIDIEVDNLDDANLISESFESHKPILYIGFIDEKNSHNIPANTLVSLLNSYQATINHSYAKIFGKNSNSKLFVEATQAASFNIKMTCEENIDLFGGTRISHVINSIDTLLKTAPEEIEGYVEEKNLRGLPINSCKTFVQTLVENGLTLKSKWLDSSPNAQIKHSLITKNILSNTLQAFENNSKLNEDIVEFEGIMTSVNSKTNRWSLEVSKNEKYSGSADQRIDFSGVVINALRYKIKCKATIGRELVKTNDEIKYELISIKELS